MRCWHQPDQRPTDRWNKFIRFIKKRHFKHFVKSYLHKVVYFFLTHFISYPKQRPTCFFCIWLTFGLISATIFKGDSSKVESIEHFRPHDNGPNVIDIWIAIYLIPMNMYIHSNHLVLQLMWSVCECVFFSFLLLERTG